jgi:hypothetical protein
MPKANDLLAQTNSLERLHGLTAAVKMASKADEKTNRRLRRCLSRAYLLFALTLKKGDGT